MTGVVGVVKARNDDIIGYLVAEVAKLLNSSKSHSVVGADYSLRTLQARAHEGVNSIFSVSSSEFSHENALVFIGNGILGDSLTECSHSLGSLGVFHRT